MTKSWRGAIVLGLAVALITTCSPAKLVRDPLPGALAPDFTLTDRQASGIARAVSTRDVLHSDVIYLIDKGEPGRVLLHSDVAPETLASDLSILLKER